MKLLLATAAVVLAGCTDSSQLSEEDNRQAWSDATTKLNKEAEQLSQLTKKLKEKDPTVISADYVLDSSDNKGIHIARDKGDGNVEVSVVPADDVKQIETKSNEAAAANHGIDGSDILLGALAGYVIANMLGSNKSRVMQASAYDEERRRNRSGYVSNSFNSARSSISNSSARGANTSVGTSKSGSFASSGARSGGYSSGG